MKKTIIIILLLFITAFILYLKSDYRISKLLKSSDKDDLIEAAIKAGESGKKKFIPLLLKDLDDPRMSHNMSFKGMTVYQAKANALQKIYGAKPPAKITEYPDSSVILFYTLLDAKHNP